MASWDSVSPPLSEETLRAIDALGFQTMTPVQSAAIPIFLSHKDVLAQAVTGSGKTLSFLIPIFEMLHRRQEPWGKHEVGAIVVSPTRELASQIYEVASHFVGGGYFTDFRLLSLIGGTKIENKKTVGAEFKKKGGNIIIATPGRLEHVLKSVPEFFVKKLEVLVLDEADRLLDMGFEHSLTNILKYLPKQRRTGLFSATQTQEVKELAKAGLRNPVKVDVKVEYKIGSVKSAQVTPQTLHNSYLIIDAKLKFSYLVHYLSQHPTHKVIVFFLTCACVDYFTKLLTSLDVLNDVKVFGLHGKMVTKRRNGMYKDFVKSSSGVLLCTDVVARGIDIPDVDLIVQYDAPQDPSYYIHRIGRTARMGKQGKAMIMIIPEEDTYIEFLKVKNVPMIKSRVDLTEIRDVTEDIKKLALSDRDVMEKAQHAFVSYIRAYKEHKCNFIFVLQNLPLAKVAHSFGLLFFPKLPDLKHLKVQYEHYNIDPSTIKYKNKTREMQRQLNMEKDAKKRELEQAEREQRKKEKEKAKKKQAPKRRRKRTHQEFVEEWDDLARENNLLKKLKKGKITKKQYDQALMNGPGDELDLDSMDDQSDGESEETKHDVQGEKRQGPASHSDGEDESFLDTAAEGIEDNANKNNGKGKKKKNKKKKKKNKTKKSEMEVEES